MPIIEIKIDIQDDTRVYNDLVDRLTSKISHVDIGVHSISGERLVAIAGAHEFGAEIQHPGGQPFIIVDARKRGGRQSRKDRSNFLPLSNGKEMIFLKKGKKGMGVTKPHEIIIPARSFIRSTVDQNRAKYQESAQAEWQDILDGKKTMRQALSILGEEIEVDIKMKIRSNIPPELKAETVRRKGSDTSLIDKGVLVNSIRYAVKTRTNNIVEISP